MWNGLFSNEWWMAKLKMTPPPSPKFDCKVNKPEANYQIT